MLCRFVNPGFIAFPPRAAGMKIYSRPLKGSRVGGVTWRATRSFVRKSRGRARACVRARGGQIR
jgi:hypothetical protein